MSSGKPSLDALRIDRSAVREPRSGKWLWIILALMIAAGAGSFYWITKKKTPFVETAVVREQAAGSSASRTLLNASGYVSARRASTVSSKVTGRVVEIVVEEGMEVKAGQLLAKLDASNVEANHRLAVAQLDSARKSLTETRSNISLAEKELKRAAALVAAQAASRSDLERAEAQVEALAARLEKQSAEISVAEAEVAQWKQQIDDTVILAPFSGIVTTKDAQPGEIISPMSSGGFTRTGICTIVDMSSLEIEVDVNESYINRVEAGQPVEATLDSYPDLKLPAKVIAIIPTADRQKATVKVRVGFDKIDPRILPDMAVKVAFRANESAPGNAGVPARSIIIPKAAVQDDAGRSIVWIVRDDIAERRAVTVSRTEGDESVISAGLSNGEEIVVKSDMKLSEGSKIKISKR